MPKSRGRKKTKQQRQSHGNPAAAGRSNAVRGLPYEFSLSSSDQDPLDAETLASAVCGAGWQADGPGTDDYAGVRDLLANAQRGMPKAGTLEFAILAARMVPDHALADQARAIAADLIARGTREPKWSAVLDDLTFRECWTMREVYGDSASVLCSFERAGRVHALSILVDLNHPGGWAHDILLVDDVVQALAMMREEAARDEAMVLEQSDPAEVRRLLEDAFEATDRTWTADVSEEFEDLRSLALSRLKVLPDPAPRVERAEVDEETRDRVVRAFLASPEAAELPAGQDLEHCVRLIVQYGADYDDGKMLRVSPAKLDIFLLGWLPRKVMLSAEERAVLPLLVPAWIKWAGSREGLSPVVLEEVLKAGRESLGHFDEVYDDAANMSPGRLLIEGLEPTENADAPQDALDRRTFAMPYFGTRIGGEDYPRLNPNDPDERSILIEGEHPEYHDALNDPAVVGEVDGVNPHLHLAMHEVVTNQLWNDDPPEVWQAARRLQAQGHDRHDILHAIGELVARQLHGVLTNHQPVDLDQYRAGLDKLGR
ncbi:uncharacterized protein DUF1841 [Kribbella antiqua]|uniref:Uncharacterized protein DUF1841 n=1 Tax=Kribbella antiqua TaxID=2512217 RepID=A0A4R2IKL8_9ACTN|nr:DUF1841 family protein [Kribbella antiqua]TCO44972.1 uncharacterized protein DUF1841 [Kribbella antiqua]